MLNDFFTVAARRGVPVFAALVAVMAAQTPVVKVPARAPASLSSTHIAQAAWTVRDANAKYYHHYP